MEYSVKGFPKEEFLRLWDLVLIAREGIHVLDFNTPVALHRVSDRLEDFNETDRPTITKSDYVGVYYSDGQIWFKPGESFRDMQDTALHELSHHEVPNERHGPTWRKVFGTSYVFYLRESGYGWDEIRHLLYTTVVAPYRTFRTIEDPVEQRRIIKGEVAWIVRFAKSKMHVLTERGNQ